MPLLSFHLIQSNSIIPARSTHPTKTCSSSSTSALNIHHIGHVLWIKHMSPFIMRLLHILPLKSGSIWSPNKLMSLPRKTTKLWDHHHHNNTINDRQPLECPQTINNTQSTPQNGIYLRCISIAYPLNIYTSCVYELP